MVSDNTDTSNALPPFLSVVSTFIRAIRGFFSSKLVAYPLNYFPLRRDNSVGGLRLARDFVLADCEN